MDGHGYEPVLRGLFERPDERPPPPGALPWDGLWKVHGDRVSAEVSTLRAAADRALADAGDAAAGFGHMLTCGEDKDGDWTCVAFPNPLWLERSLRVEWTVRQTMSRFNDCLLLHLHAPKDGEVEAALGMFERAGGFLIRRGKAVKHRVGARLEASWTASVVRGMDAPRKFAVVSGRVLAGSAMPAAGSIALASDVEALIGRWKSESIRILKARPVVCGSAENAAEWFFGGNARLGRLCVERTASGGGDMRMTQSREMFVVAHNLKTLAAKAGIELPPRTARVFEKLARVGRDDMNTIYTLACPTLWNKDRGLVNVRVRHPVPMTFQFFSWSRLEVETPEDSVSDPLSNNWIAELVRVVAWRDWGGLSGSLRPWIAACVEGLERLCVQGEAAGSVRNGPDSMLAEIARGFSERRLGSFYIKTGASLDESVLRHRMKALEDLDYADDPVVRSVESRDNGLRIMLKEPAGVEGLHYSALERVFQCGARSVSPIMLSARGLEAVRPKPVHGVLFRWTLVDDLARDAKVSANELVYTLKRNGTHMESGHPNLRGWRMCIGDLVGSLSEMALYDVIDMLRFPNLDSPYHTKLFREDMVPLTVTEFAREWQDMLARHGGRPDPDALVEWTYARFEFLELFEPDSMAPLLDAMHNGFPNGHMFRAPRSRAVDEAEAEAA